METARLSVVLVTRNPQPYVLQWALDSLANQTLPASQFEIVVVDNGSTKPLETEALRRGRNLNIRVIQEPVSGVTFARCTGILQARADLLVFLDDDNYVDPNYLEEALRIAREGAGIGAFGGIARFLSEGYVPPWKQTFLPFLGIRDYGPNVITSNENRWGEWEPIGAGMVFRKDVGLRFVEIIRTDPQARTLGRRGKSFICGEDALLARIAYLLGYSCSYQPSLRLTHFIRSSRLTAANLARTIEGVAQAFVICEHVMNRPVAKWSPLEAAVELTKRCRYRMQTKGKRAGFIEWFWDIGFYRRARLEFTRSAGKPQALEARQ
jgi:glycosyltransferase involved in cell wall biosynthesis